MNSPAQILERSGGDSTKGDDSHNIPIQFSLFNSPIDFEVEFFLDIIHDPQNAYWLARWGCESPEAVASLLRRAPDAVLESLAVWSNVFRHAAMAELHRRRNA